MTVEVIKGDLFDSDAEALVNPVNCVGVMGAGVAKQFMQRYPEACTRFNKLSKDDVMRQDGVIRPGHVYIDASIDPHIIFFTTKNHWKNPSRFDWVRHGIAQLEMVCATYEINSVAMPAIGCGVGGLSFEGQVLPELHKQLGDNEWLHVEVRLR